LLLPQPLFLLLVLVLVLVLLVLLRYLHGWCRCQGYILLITPYLLQRRARYTPVDHTP
jgi:hypothetical protein